MKIKSFTRKFKKLIFVMASMHLLVSCDDFLSETPDNRVELDDLEKASQLLTSAYSIASPAFSDWMTDDFSYTIGTTLRLEHRQMYEWADVTTGPTDLDTPNFFWYETYNAISHANEVLAIIDDLPVLTGRDEARKNAVKSEALLTRAYGHFMLVNFFAEHFGVSNSDPGVPYIKVPETTFLATYQRESIRKVYDEVEDDLLEGLELLDDTFFENSGKYHFNRNAALAFASRFYLFKADFIRCLQYSNQLLGSNPESFVRDITSQEFRLAKGSITGYPQLYSSVEQTSNLLMMRKISLVQRTDFAYGIEENFYREIFGTNPFGATDERTDPAFIKGENATFPARYESLFERSSINSNVGTPYHIHIAFRGEEVLMNRIEVNVFQNNIDEAIADLQILTDRRYTGADVTITMDLLRTFYQAEDDPDFSDQDILLNYLLFERRKEFMGQGYRWYDIKRYPLTVTHVLADGISITELGPNDNRRAFQIPPSAIEVGGLEPNPR